MCIAQAEDDVRVDFMEFQEAVGAIACYKVPSPYVSLEFRLRKFIERFLRTKYEADGIARRKKARSRRG
jgi:hypothetical protein